MSAIFANLWGRLIGRPLLVTPECARDLTAYLMGRSNLSNGFIVENDAVHAVSDLMAGVTSIKARSDHTDQFYRVIDGVAIVPVRGTLVQRLGLHPYCGMTGYDGIARKVDQAVGDSSVKGIMLEIDSPGGEVAGVLELGETIRAAREKKPVWAVADEKAYSAGYWVGAQATRLIVPKTGGVGSIGVITMHADYSERLKGDGVKVTIISAGAHKADGNPFQPLPDDVRDRVAAEVEATRQLFAQEVVKGRSNLSVEDVLATEAQSYAAEEAVEIGLVDGVQSSKSAMADFIATLSGRTVIGPIQSKGASEMDKPNDDNRPDAIDPGATEANVANATQSAASASDERKRIAGILSSKEADGRKDLAEHLAYNTDLSVEAATAMLSKAPVAKADILSDAMAGEPNSVIGDEGEPPREPSKAENLAANFAAMTGRKPKG
ncbi:signal peptide peptidase SppA [Thalassospira sp. MBR-102]|jgi:signal peptide peptidase SppA|uniref:S49 family peptidase n=1 Tax=Thalassospira sp. MBR-102 TaxID=3156466 RepID=UPI0029E84F1E|nr:S49 family peptidase [Rhodospirillales bacterium]MBR9816907.1 S49 family peptidase [Rhodospirillales bacterium]